MDRRQELLKIIGDNNLILPLVDEVLHIEAQLIELKKLPFISINPKNPAQQKATPAAKLYKELLQQYTNCIKVLSKVTNQDEDDEESPLRKWVKKRVNQE